MKGIIILLVILIISNIYAADNNIKRFNDSKVKLKPFEKKSLTGAIILETFIPTIGYLYAGNWKKGIIPATLRISGFVLAAYQLELYHLRTLVVKNKFLYTSGLIIGFGGLAWSYMGLKNVVDDYNRALRFSLTPCMGNPKNIMLTLSYGF